LVKYYVQEEIFLRTGLGTYSGPGELTYTIQGKPETNIGDLESGLGISIPSHHSSIQARKHSNLWNIFHGTCGAYMAHFQCRNDHESVGVRFYSSNLFYSL